MTDRSSTFTGIGPAGSRSRVGTLNSITAQATSKRCRFRLSRRPHVPSIGHDDTWIDPVIVSTEVVNQYLPASDASGGQADFFCWASTRRTTYRIVGRLVIIPRP